MDKAAGRRLPVLVLCRLHCCTINQERQAMGVIYTRFLLSRKAT